MPDADIPDAVAWIIIAGFVAVALLNLGKVARFLRIPQACGRLVSWLATIARDAFVQGARDGITEIVRDELEPDGNGGHNLRGAIDRIEVLVNDLHADFQHHISDVKAHITDPDAHD